LRERVGERVADIVGSAGTALLLHHTLFPAFSRKSRRRSK
jgi:hypothetical protein